MVAEGTGAGHSAPTARALIFQTQNSSATQNNACNTHPQGLPVAERSGTHVLFAAPLCCSAPFIILATLPRHF